MRNHHPTAAALVVLATACLNSPLVSASGDPELPMIGADNDNPSHPLGDKQKALRKTGLEMKLNGKVKGPVAEVAKGQFVELEREGEDSIWTVIADFGPADHPAPILFSGIPGPLHNEIP